MQALPRPLRWPPIFPLQKELVLWLPLDDRSGSKAYDRSGKLNHGTLEGPTWVAGKRGSALIFDGENDYVDCGVVDTFDASKQYTFVAWLNLAQLPSVKASDMVLFARKTIGTGIYFGIDRFSDKLEVNNPNGWGNDVGNTVLSINLRYFVVYVYDNQTISFFLNGVSDGSVTAGVFVDNNTKVVIGANEVGDENNFNGIISEARIYKRVLTAAEIKRLYESEIMLVRL